MLTCGFNIRSSYLPLLGYFHANSGACHCLTKSHRDHEEIVDTPTKGKFESVLHRT